MGRLPLSCNFTKSNTPPWVFFTFLYIYIYRPWKVYDYDFYNRASDIQRGIIGLSDENEMCAFMMKTVPKMRRSIYHPDPSLLLQYFVLIKICSLLIVLSDAL